MSKSRPSPRPVHRYWKRFFRTSGILAAMLVVANLVLHLLLPYPWGDPRLEAKLRRLEKHGDEIDTLFLGSSYTYRQISPRIFDEELGEAGPGRSFNLAVDGMHLPAGLRLLEHLETLELPRLRRVILELGRFTSAVDPDVDHAPEAKAWRSPRYTLSMIRFLWHRPDKGVPGKLRQTARLLGIQVETSLHIGLGPHLLERAFGFHRATTGMSGRGIAPGRVSPEMALGPDRDGFYAVDRQALDLTGLPLDNRFLRRSDAADTLAADRLACVRAFEAPLEAPNPEGLRFLKAVIELAEDNGWTPFFFVPPRLGDRYAHLRPLFEHLPEEMLVANLADPRYHHAFHRLEESADRGHLNEKGAERLSRLLAKEVAAREVAAPRNGESDRVKIGE